MRVFSIIAAVVIALVLLVIFFEDIYNWITDAPTTVSGAIFDGDLEALKEMLAKNPSALKQVDSSGDTLLHDAARHDKPEIVRYLLSKGLDPAARDDFNKTPLHDAARWSSPGSAKLLVKSDPAILEVSDDLGRTALHIAAGDFGYKPLEAGRVAVAKILIDAGANIHARNNSGKTPLQCAARRGSAKVVKWLIEAGADPDVRVVNDYQEPDDPPGNSAMQIAAHYGNYEVVQILLKHGAPVIYLTIPRRQIYESALHSACAPYLERYKDGSGNFPEDETFPRERKTIDLLMAQVGDPNIVAKPRFIFEGTPLQIAASQSHIRIVRHLLEQYPTMIVPTNVRLADDRMNGFLSGAAKRQKAQWAQAPPNTLPTLTNIAYTPPSEGLDAAGYLTGTIQDETRRPASYQIEVDFDGDRQADDSGRYPAEDWGFSYQVQLTAGPRELWLRVLEYTILNEEPLASEWKHFAFTVIPAPNKPPWRCGFSYEVEGDSLDIRGGFSDFTGQNSDYRVEIDSDGDGRSNRSLIPDPFVRYWTEEEWQVRKFFKTSFNAPNGPEAVRIRVIELRKGKPVAITDWIDGKEASSSIDMPDLSEPVVAPRPG